MLLLGDLSKGYGDFLKAVKLWETAPSLFEWSSQVKQVENIDERLTGVGEDVLEQASATQKEFGPSCRAQITIRGSGRTGRQCL
jgi:hypothetical protein